MRLLLKYTLKYLNVIASHWVEFWGGAKPARLCHSGGQSPRLLILLQFIQNVMASRQVSLRAGAKPARLCHSGGQSPRLKSIQYVIASPRAGLRVSVKQSPRLLVSKSLIKDILIKLCISYYLIWKHTQPLSLKRNGIKLYSQFPKCRDCFALPHRHSLRLAMTVFMLAGLLISCEEQTDWDMKTTDINTIVVDARMTNEYKHHQIHLTKPFTDPNGEVLPVLGASVIVETGTNFIEFIESSVYPGYYISSNPAVAVVNTTYQLSINYEGIEYSAQTHMIPVLSSAHPQWILDTETGLYRINWPAGPYNPYQQAMFEAIISWSHLVDSSYTDTLTYARLMYYTFNTIDVSYVIVPQEKEDVLVPKNSIAIVKKYSLTDEYASYLRALLAETEWQGSLFEEARGNLPTNISNGGLGFFSASSVIADTILVGSD